MLFIKVSHYHFLHFYVWGSIMTKLLSQRCKTLIGFYVNICFFTKAQIPESCPRVRALWFQTANIKQAFCELSRCPASIFFFFCKLSYSYKYTLSAVASLSGCLKIIFTWQIRDGASERCFSSIRQTLPFHRMQVCRTLPFLFLSFSLFCVTAQICWPDQRQRFRYMGTQHCRFFVLKWPFNGKVNIGLKKSK